MIFSTMQKKITCFIACFLFTCSIVSSSLAQSNITELVSQIEDTTSSGEIAIREKLSTHVGVINTLSGSPQIGFDYKFFKKTLIGTELVWGKRNNKSVSVPENGDKTLVSRSRSIGLYATNFLSSEEAYQDSWIFIGGILYRESSLTFYGVHKTYQTYSGQMMGGYYWGYNNGFGIQVGLGLSVNSKEDVLTAKVGKQIVEVNERQGLFSPTGRLSWYYKF